MMLDRDKAREVLLWTYGGREVEQIEATLDALEACCTPHGWDELLRILAETYPESIFPRQHDEADFGNGPQVVSLLQIINDLRQTPPQAIDRDALVELLDPEVLAALHAAEAKLSKIEAFLVWSQDELHLRADELVPDLLAVVRGEDA